MFQNEELFWPREEWAERKHRDSGGEWGKETIISFPSSSLFSRRQNTETLIRSLRKHLFPKESPYTKLGYTPIFLTHYFDLLLFYFLVRLRKSSILILILVRWTELTSTLKLSKDWNLVSFDINGPCNHKALFSREHEYTCRDVLVGIRNAVGSDKVSLSQFPYPNFPTASFSKGVLVR